MMSLVFDRSLVSTIATLLACLLAVSALRAQDTVTSDAESQSWDVFVKYNDSQSGTAELVFFNLLTGEATSISSSGERFTLVDEGVIYFDRGEKQVKFVAADGRVSDHGLMNMPADALRIDWIVSDDRQTIAWTVTHSNQDNRLLTRTMIADSGGGDVREILTDGPWIDSRVLPVAFSATKDELYMDAHPDGISEYEAYSIHANLFSVNLSDGSLRLLPNESRCFCSTVIRNDLLLQLMPSPEFDGVQVRLDHISGGASRIIPAIPHNGFFNAGNLLPNPDGTHAVYVLSQERSLSQPDNIPQSIIVLADLEAMEQSVVGEPVNGLLFPFGWSEGNAAVLFTDESESRTWKLDLSNGTISEVAAARYLGRLESR